MNVMKQGYNKVIEHVRSELRVYVTIVLTTITLLMAAIAWTTTNFVTTVRADNSHQQMLNDMTDSDNRITAEVSKLTAEVSELNSLVLIHMDKHSLESVKLAIKTNESETFQLERLIDTEEPRDQDLKRLRQLQAEKKDLEQRRQCIIDHNRLCD